MTSLTFDLTSDQEKLPRNRKKNISRGRTLRESNRGGSLSRMDRSSRCHVYRIKCHRVTTHSMNITEMYEYIVVGMDHDPAGRISRAMAGGIRHNQVQWTLWDLKSRRLQGGFNSIKGKTSLSSLVGTGSRRRGPGDRGQETGSRWRGPGDGVQETGSRRQGPGDWVQEAGSRWQVNGLEVETVEDSWSRFMGEKPSTYTPGHTAVAKATPLEDRSALFEGKI